MAEQENIERSRGAEPQGERTAGSSGKLLPWLVPALVVLVLAVGGFSVGRLFGARGSTGTASGAEANMPSEATQSKEPVLKSGTNESWYYTLDPIVVNLNEPGVTRYVRVGLALEMGGTMDEKEGRLFLDEKKPLMKHWLTLFLSDLTIEDARGEKNLIRMQTQITEMLNNALFPGSKPRIKDILLQEFAIQ